MSLRILFLTLVLLTLAPQADAKILHVAQTGDGSDGSTWEKAFTDISSALVAASSGDDVWVAGGIYSESVELIPRVGVFGGFSGTESAVGFDFRDWEGNETIIDATGLEASAVLGADDAILDGFTIRSAVSLEDGSGIRCVGTSPVVLNCTIQGNQSLTPKPVQEGCCEWVCLDPLVCRCIQYCWVEAARGRGGGIYLRSSDALFANCTISHNHAYEGGGLLIDGSGSPSFLECNFVGNSAGDEGGGVEIEGSGSPYFLECDFVGNRAHDGGGCRSSGESVVELASCRISSNTAFNDGGLFATSRSTFLLDCVIQKNRSNYEGGGIYLLSKDARLERCDIAENSSGVSGAGIYCEYTASTTVTNCVFRGNTSSWEGSWLGIGDRKSRVSILNCSVYGNHTKTDSPSLLCESPSTTDIVNSILWENDPHEIEVETGAELSVNFCDVEGGWPGEGNIDADPRFRDAEHEDYRLLPDSPCIDSASADGPEGDLEGNPCPIDLPGVGRDGEGAFDMGAYEYPLGGYPSPTPTATVRPTTTPTSQPTLVNPNSDINQDGVINAEDLLILLQDWQKVTGT